MRTYEQNRSKIQSGDYDMWLDADLPDDDNHRQEDEAFWDAAIDQMLERGEETWM